MSRMSGNIENNPEGNKQGPIEVKEDALKDEMGNMEYIALYDPSKISSEAQEAVKNQIQKYTDGEYSNEKSAIYISTEREVLVTDVNDEPTEVKEFTGMKIIFDTNGIPSFMTFSNEIDRINNLRIQAEKAEIDFLTGLHNRNGWETSIDSLAYDIQRDLLDDENYITIFYADLNNLKEKNDKGGHSEGDKYIVKMAEFLRKIFSRDKDELARWGGDEFGVLTISNHPFESVAVQRLTQFKSKEIQYCAGIGSFKIKDFLVEMGVTKEMFPEEKLKRIKEGLLSKVKEIDKLEKEAKEYSKQTTQDEERPTIIYRQNKTSRDVFQLFQSNSPLSVNQP